MSKEALVTKLNVLSRQFPGELRNTAENICVSVVGVSAAIPEYKTEMLPAWVNFLGYTARSSPAVYRSLLWVVFDVSKL
jgi:hypothetical protein